MAGDRVVSGLRADGEEFPLEAAISVATVAGRKWYTVILRDVTERVRDRAELQRYADIVESLGDAVMSRTVEGAMLTWNAAAEQLFGYTRAEVAGMGIGFLYSPNTPAGHRNSIAHAAAEGPVNFETVLRHKDGSDIHVAVTISLVRDAAGRITGSSVIFRDITERSRVDDELRRLGQEQHRAEMELRESRDRLRELSSALQSVREEEKTRIARELLDELG